MRWISTGWTGLPGGVGKEVVIVGEAGGGQGEPRAAGRVPSHPRETRQQTRMIVLHGLLSMMGSSCCSDRCFCVVPLHDTCSKILPSPSLVSCLYMVFRRVVLLMASLVSG